MARNNKGAPLHRRKKRRNKVQDKPISEMERKILSIIEENPSIIEHPREIADQILKDEGVSPSSGKIDGMIDHYILHKKPKYDKTPLIKKHPIEAPKPIKNITPPGKFTSEIYKEIEHPEKEVPSTEILKGKKLKIINAFNDNINKGRTFSDDKDFFDTLAKEGIYKKDQYQAFYQQNRLLKKDGITIDFANSTIIDYSKVEYKEPNSTKIKEIIKLMKTNDKFFYKQMLLPTAAQKLEMDEDAVWELIKQYNDGAKKPIKFKRGRFPNKYQSELDKSNKLEELIKEKPIPEEIVEKVIEPPQERSLEHRTIDYDLSREEHNTRWVNGKYVHSIHEQLLILALIASNVKGKYKSPILINGQKVYFSFVKYIKDETIVIDAIQSYDSDYYIKKRSLVEDLQRITYITFTYEDLKDPAKAFEEKFKGIDMLQFI